MKNYRLLLMLMIVFLSSCGNQERIHSFDRQVEEQASKIYKPYAAKSFQNGEIPPNTLVQIRGTITVTDNADGRSIKKNDRFILEAEGERYQVINGSDSEWTLLECVTIYGEYYGFIKAEEIKK
ncbi:hypothetical protein [uncultured Enterococcus sp.]|uniref:hypothetical protein n=1 Tax=uncultured Enterococcus sp. TaxID=167972 RepID=UPI002AA7C9EC|nr:hypothetical protein [uncultured Enterococcus sp.]